MNQDDSRAEENKGMQLEVASEVCSDCGRLHAFITIPGFGIAAFSFDAMQATTLAVSLTSPFVAYLTAQDAQKGKAH